MVQYFDIITDKDQNITQKTYVYLIEDKNEYIVRALSEDEPDLLWNEEQVIGNYWSIKPELLLIQSDNKSIFPNIYLTKQSFTLDQVKKYFEINPEENNEKLNSSGTLCQFDDDSDIELTDPQQPTLLFFNPSYPPRSFGPPITLNFFQEYTKINKGEESPLLSPKTSTKQFSPKLTPKQQQFLKFINEEINSDEDEKQSDNNDIKSNYTFRT